MKDFFKQPKTLACDICLVIFDLNISLIYTYITIAYIIISTLNVS